jgi:hypothetical protein
MIFLQINFFKIIFCGKLLSEEICKHFEKITKVDRRDQKTPYQKCNYCRNNIVDLID